MHGLFAAYLEKMRGMHAEFARVLDGLTPAQLDWSPAPTANSLAVLAAHVAGAERYWLVDILGHGESARDRDSEFSTADAEAAALQGRLAAAMAAMEESVSRLTLDDLGRVLYSPQHKRENTVAWALVHVLEHTATHLGHAQAVRDLMNSQ
jgi:uncharacterized damage-inducible protein DinB